MAEMSGYPPSSSRGLYCYDLQQVPPPSKLFERVGDAWIETVLENADAVESGPICDDRTLNQIWVRVFINSPNKKSQRRPRLHPE